MPDWKLKTLFNFRFTDDIDINSTDSKMIDFPPGWIIGLVVVLFLFNTNSGVGGGWILLLQKKKLEPHSVKMLQCWTN